MDQPIYSDFWLAGGVLSAEWATRADAVDPDNEALPTPLELRTWAALPLEQLRAAEAQIYGAPLSNRRAISDRPPPQRQKAE